MIHNFVIAIAAYERGLVVFVKVFNKIITVAAIDNYFLVKFFFSTIINPVIIIINSVITRAAVYRNIRSTILNVISTIAAVDCRIVTVIVNIFIASAAVYNDIPAKVAKIIIAAQKINADIAVNIYQGIVIFSGVAVRKQIGFGANHIYGLVSGVFKSD